LLIVSAVLVLGRIASAEEAAPNGSAAPGGDTLSLDRYYGDAVSRIGSFPGRLVCVAIGQPFVPDNAVHCAPDKVYALSIENPQAVVPLLAASNAASGQLKSLLGTKVVVRGKHYPDKGMIAVASLESGNTAADAPLDPAPLPPETH
jgi:hypothetical protein